MKVVFLKLDHQLINCSDLPKFASKASSRYHNALGLIPKCTMRDVLFRNVTEKSTFAVLFIES